MVFITRSKVKVAAASTALWLKIVAIAGFIALLFVATPRIFDHSASGSGVDIVYADAPTCSDCGDCGVSCDISGCGDCGCGDCTTSDGSSDGSGSDCGSCGGDCGDCGS